MTRFSNRTVIAAFTDVSFGEACHIVNLYRHMTDSYIKAAEFPFVRNKIRAELQKQHPWLGYFRYDDPSPRSNEMSWIASSVTVIPYLSNDHQRSSAVTSHRRSSP